MLLSAKTVATTNYPVQSGELGDSIVRSLHPWVNAVAEQFGWEIADYQADLRRWEIPQFYSEYTVGAHTVIPFQRTRDLTLSEPEDGLVALMETGELRASTATDIHESGSVLISVTMKTGKLRREWFWFRFRIESMDASVVRLESYRKIFWSEDINPNHALKDSVWDKTLRK